ARVVLVGPTAVQVSVPQDAEQPSLSAAPVAELVQPELRFAKRVLGQVFRVGGAPGQAVRVAIQRQVVCVDESLDAHRSAGPQHAGTHLFDRGRDWPVYSRPRPATGPERPNL